MMNPVVTLVKDLAGRLTGARTAIGELRAADEALREALAGAESERQRLLSARPPKPEVLQALDGELEQLATEWRAQRGPALVSALSGALDVTPAGEIRGVVRYVSLADAVGPLSLAALAALAPALVREGVRAVIASTPYGEEGPPMRARAALVAEVDGKIAALVTEHAALVDNAGAVGITLAHLPATLGQRAQAAQAHERWARDQVANRAYYKHHPSASPREPEGAP